MIKHYKDKEITERWNGSFNKLFNDEVLGL